LNEIEFLWNRDWAIAGMLIMAKTIQVRYLESMRIFILILEMALLITFTIKPIFRCRTHTPSGANSEAAHFHMTVPNLLKY